MQSSQALREAMVNLLAADAATLAPAAGDENKLALVKTAFVPAETLLIGDVTLADFDGSTPLLVEDGTQPTALDPFTNDSIIDLLPPAGGFRWETTGVTNLPQTIFGYVLMNEAGTTLLASALFDTPIELTAINQRIDVDAAELRIPAGAIS